MKEVNEDRENRMNAVAKGSGLLYNVDGSIEVVTPENGKDFKLHELTSLIGCEYIEIIPIGTSHIMVLDEEGKLHDPPSAFNNLATMQALRHRGIFAEDVIVGKALICPRRMVK